ncbi:TetR/AcrR family transcriptional regulator [Gryllotalpicola reticulitermitis]|uniref:TetR/AcrR family transcriptional regulator n=1 Tax=Gryllotalpicola reticulitermitis TaxID=1184153 RepID=A0ABV8QCD8_9MICO
MTVETDARASNRQRIVAVAAALLRDGGQSAVTTRSVADRAGVQAPTIYRLFGDKDGLLDAIAEHEMTIFATAKRSAVAVAADDDIDPIEDLRTGWDMTVGFGLANPDLYALISDPSRRPRSPAAAAGMQLLADRVHRVARAGRLQVSEDRAVDLIHAAGTGAVLATLAKPAAERDQRLADAMFDAILTQIIAPDDVDRAARRATPTESPIDVAAHAVALRAHADDLAALSENERRMLTEWLDRVIAGPRP